MATSRTRGSSCSRTLAELLAAEESPKDEVLFLLRIGDEPVPGVDELSHAITLNVAEMKALMDELPELDETYQE